MRLPKRVRWPVVLAAGVVLAGGGTAYAALGGADTPTYRTVTAAKGDVEQTLAMSGVVDAARRADLSFGTDGTVARVAVEQGDTVRAGQVIARLGTADLDAAVAEAEAALAQAEAQLAADRDQQTASVAQPSDAGKPAGGKPGGDTGSTGAANAAANAAMLKKLKAQQQAVLDAQSRASAAIAAAKAALAAQTTTCADAYQAAPAPATSAASGDGPGPSDVDEQAADAGTDCADALAEVQAKQAAVSQAQDDLADALTALTRTLSAALGTVTGQPSGAPSARSSDRSTTAAPGGDDVGAPGAPGGTVTAATLAADQAQVDQATADLVSARAARSQAVLRSTRSGTVVSLDLARGDHVSAGSTVAVVVGGRAVTLTGTVAETSVEKVKVGQTARVTVAGSAEVTRGTVTAIGLVADSSSGTASFPVTVTVEDPTIALPTGSRAQVAIVLSTAQDVVTVPISAVSRTGDATSVRTWDGSELATVRVTVGAVGPRTVAITEGVEIGDQVVLADVDQAIEGASSEINQRGGFGPPSGGQFTFRSGAPGGMPGGMPGGPRGR